MSGEWRATLNCTKAGPVPNLSNAVLVLHSDPTLGPDYIWYDEFRDLIFTTRGCAQRPWTDEDDYALTVYMQDDPIGITHLNDHIVKKAVRLVAKQRTKHCVRDWLNGLKWDGEPRIAMALEDHWGVETEVSQPLDYVRAVSTNLFIAMVARVMVPGCKVDEMIVFEGRTGAKKSMALEVLAGEWHGVAHSRVTEKDFFQDIQGKWLMVVDELDSFSKAQVERIKSVITTRKDTFRGSYDSRSSDHYRNTVLSGTTNRDDWGHDETGLRRFMPIRVGHITPDTLAAARDQLFAEAVLCFKEHQPWWQYPISAADVQFARQHYDEWTDPVMKWCNEQSVTRPRLTVGEVLEGALRISPKDAGKAEEMRVGRILSLCGWQKGFQRVNGIPCRFWVSVTTCVTTTDVPGGNAQVVDSYDV